MSLSSTSTIKTQLRTALGSKAPRYFHVFQQFVAGRISRTEFDDAIRQCLDAPSLVQLHNSLIISLFDFSSHRRPPTPPPEDAAAKPPPRKRRRTLPYQGPDDREDGLLRSARLKRWAVAVGKRERERLKGLPSAGELPRARPDMDEIARERGLILLSERGEPPGSRLPLHLATVSQSLTLPQVIDRVNLICAQHNLNMPTRNVSSLILLATQAHIKQLITQAIALTSSSRSITSITTTAHAHPHIHAATHLRLSTFSTLLTLSPALLPNDSAAARRLAMIGDGEGEGDDPDEDVALLKDREVRDQRWQLMALLGERSTVRGALRTMR
ncbi:hypothetical protein FIBSPDRAFT_748463 [Athelia psychrophila]|uniref:Transcriptional regulator of RNA polII, SAGA, subunit-domain-containing protein n=1 Tax=Athelia psychrophila TaxID=1759441 RepID=A0A166FBG8_9AGAM|nr:hypothetical protein FIBSPDRAFT_748463 [Fibularhizoctonia sp. CBS 109695]